MANTIYLWLQAFFTLALLSAPFKDNQFYKFAESLFVGLYAGYFVVVTYYNYIRPSTMNIFMNQQYYLFIPVFIGLLIYTRYIKRLQWLARYNMAFVVGVGSGLVLARDFKALVLAQVVATFKPLWVAGKLGTSINNIIVVVGVMSVMWYFLFTVQKKGVPGYISAVGRTVMMVALGAAFGNAVMQRVSLFLGRATFILGDWLHLMK
jgi:hypothetical protein